MSGRLLSAVIPDGFDGAGFHGRFALGFFFRRAGLLVNERVPVLVVAGEIIRRFGSASVAINALIVYKISTSRVIWPFLLSVCHRM